MVMILRHISLQVGSWFSLKQLLTALYTLRCGLCHSIFPKGLRLQNDDFCHVCNAKDRYHHALSLSITAPVI
ncbi:hypothetical protein EV421DRAFT_1855356, partial [Armillaria borealis]